MVSPTHRGSYHRKKPLCVCVYALPLGDLDAKPAQRGMICLLFSSENNCRFDPVFSKGNSLMGTKKALKMESSEDAKLRLKNYIPLLQLEYVPNMK